MQYVFKWSRGFITRSRKVAGHRYDQIQDKMVLYFQDGSVEEIANWRGCSVRLGADWVAAKKADMEKSAGSAVPLAV